MRTYHIARWNLENLFHEENAVRSGSEPTKCSEPSRTTSPAGCHSFVIATSTSLPR
jgi:hypothetical protein